MRSQLTASLGQEKGNVIRTVDEGNGGDVIDKHK